MRSTASRTIRLFVVAIVFASVTGATCVMNSGPPSDEPTPEQINAALALVGDDHVIGAETAPVTVIEYADFECPVCGQFAREVYPALKAEFIDTGKVKWVLRHFPLRRIHPCAEAAARASECAHDQGRFFEFAKVMFENQDDLCTAGLKILGANPASDLNTNAFNTCVDNSASKADRVQRDVNTGTILNITGTPTFFINGAKVVGFQSVESMRNRINAAMAP